MPCAGSWPGSPPTAVLIVLHIALDSPMAMAGMLGWCAVMPVAYAEQSGRIEPGRIYLAPPGSHLVVIGKGVLGLTSGDPVHRSRPAVDVLFRSAARVDGTRIVGVVLTGGDHDGTDGLRAIKRAGGTTVVQTPHMVPSTPACR